MNRSGPFNRDSDHLYEGVCSISPYVNALHAGAKLICAAAIGIISSPLGKKTHENLDLLSNLVFCSRLDRPGFGETCAAKPRQSYPNPVAELLRFYQNLVSRTVDRRFPESRNLLCMDGSRMDKLSFPRSARWFQLARSAFQSMIKTLLPVATWESGRIIAIQIHTSIGGQ